MRILVDNALSFRVAELLCANGHDAQHVLDVGLGAASDLTIVEHARHDDRMILSIDTDFGALLAQQQSAKPSFILLRWPGLRRAEDRSGYCWPIFHM